MNKFLKCLFVFAIAFGLAAGGMSATVHAAEKSEKSTKTGKVDVNKATQEELEALPGIGAAYAKKIIDNRPYNSADDLVKIGIPQSTVDKIKGSIKFSKPKAEKTTKPKSTTPKSTTTKSATTKSTQDQPAKVAPHKGMVWVNTDTMIYHKEGDQWYGNTEHGEFMTEDKAVKAGARASKHN